LVGPPGFEPGTSCTPSKRASQAAPRPDKSMVSEQAAGICALASYVERFIQERQYLKGVSPSTLAWYRFSFQAFAPVLESAHDSSSEFKGSVMNRIQALRQQGRGNKPVSINTYLRCFKTFLNWCHQEQILKEPVKLSWLKEEQKVLATFSAAHISLLLNWKPVKDSQRRLHALIYLFLDSGLRLSEALGLSKDDVDFDNLVIKVKGKGGKHRLVPMSLGLRKVLFRWRQKIMDGSHHSGLMFPTKYGTQLRGRDSLRDFTKLCRKLGITGVRCSPHTLRHTFAVNYLRAGGNLFYLSKILGHTSVKTTERYLQSLQIEDLQAVHDRLSLLSNAHP
jgi:integrase/recombinase XerD